MLCSIQNKNNGMLYSCRLLPCIVIMQMAVPSSSTPVPVISMVRSISWILIESFILLLFWYSCISETQGNANPSRLPQIRMERFNLYTSAFINENSLSNFPVSSHNLVFDTQLQLKLKLEENLWFVWQPFKIIMSILLYCQVCHLNIVWCYPVVIYQL